MGKTQPKKLANIVLSNKKRGLVNKLYETQIKNLPAEPPKAQDMYDAQKKCAQEIASKTQQTKYEFISDYMLNADADLANKEVTSEVYSKVINAINSVLAANIEGPVNKRISGIGTAEENNAEALKIRAYLQEMQATHGVVSQELLDEFSRTIMTVAGDRVSLSGAGEKYKQLKSKEAEEIAVQMINLRLGNQIKALRTGNWYVGQGNVGGGKQPIQDLLVFDKSLLSSAGALKSGQTFSITFNQGGQGTRSSQVSTFQEFFDEIEKAMNNHETINITDELFDILTDIARFSAQVKSGLNKQSLLTDAARNSLQIRSFFFSGLSKTEYSVLTDIYNTFGEEVFNQQGVSPAPEPYVTALANYALSHELQQTQLAKNQLYFTTFGWLTLDSWLETPPASVLKLVGSVARISNQELNGTRRYQFYPLKV